MQNNYWQHHRLRVGAPGDKVKFEFDTNKNFKRVKGIFVSVPQDAILIAATMGLRINGKEMFDDTHEMKALSANLTVAPNDRFFIFPEDVPAAGSKVEGVYRDGQANPYLFANGQDNTGVLNPLGAPNVTAGVGANPFGIKYAHDITVVLWLTNDPLVTPDNVVETYKQAYNNALKSLNIQGAVAGSGQPLDLAMRAGR